jgi:hypothetical protein
VVPVFDRHRPARRRLAPNACVGRGACIAYKIAAEATGAHAHRVDDTLTGALARLVLRISAVGFGRGGHMLWTVFVLLLVLWALGLVSSYTLGGFIHLLLLLAVGVLLIRIIQGRNPVT